MKEASLHRPVLLDEAVQALRVEEDGVYVDGTFGRGGHSRAILSRLGPGGRLYAFDRDLEAVAEGRRIADPRFTILHESFGRIAGVLAGLGVTAVDGVLLDLGVSSPQLADASRGFSFRADGPLDMRMDATRGPTAAEWIATVTEKNLEEVIRDYGEERFAKQIARAVVAARSREPIARTRQLAEIVAKAVRTREPGQDPATRTFQAVRIFINQELEDLQVALPACIDLLRPGGRLVVISFHSLEDRIIKRCMREAAQPPQPPRRLAVRAADLPQPRLRLVGRLVRPGADEIADNPRARSAGMRIAERLPAPSPRQGSSP